MDDDLREESEKPRTKSMAKDDKEKSKSIIKLHDVAEKAKAKCCVVA